MTLTTCVIIHYLSSWVSQRLTLTWCDKKKKQNCNNKERRPKAPNYQYTLSYDMLKKNILFIYFFLNSDVVVNLLLDSTKIMKTFCLKLKNIHAKLYIDLGNFHSITSNTSVAKGNYIFVTYFNLHIGKTIRRVLAIFQIFTLLKHLPICMKLRALRQSKWDLWARFKLNWHLAWGRTNPALN